MQGRELTQLSSGTHGISGTCLVKTSDNIEDDWYLHEGGGSDDRARYAAPLSVFFPSCRAAQMANAGVMLEIALIKLYSRHGVGGRYTAGPASRCGAGTGGVVYVAQRRHTAGRHHEQNLNCPTRSPKISRKL